MPNLTYDELVSGWERLLAAASEIEGNLPVAERLRAALEWHLQETKAAKARKEHHTAASQQARKDFHQLMAGSGEVARRLRCLMKAVLDPTDKRLAQFGVTRSRKQVPRKGRSSREASQEPSGPKAAE